MSRAEELADELEELVDARRVLSLDYRAAVGASRVEIGRILDACSRRISALRVALAELGDADIDELERGVALERMGT